MKAELIDHMGNDESVIRAAKVSFAADGSGITSAAKKRLLSYLATHDHWTPFSHTAITIRTCAPVPIRTQCFKHKIGFVENEESRRYISGTPEVFFPEEWRAAPTGNRKQGSDGPLDNVSQAIVSDLYQNSVEIALGAYEAMLTQGASPEQARFVLPQGCEVNWYWTGNLMSFARFYNQRTDSHAQGEITELAETVGEIIAPLFPMAWPLLTNKQ